MNQQADGRSCTFASRSRFICLCLLEINAALINLCVNGVINILNKSKRKNDYQLERVLTRFDLTSFKIGFSQTYYKFWLKPNNNHNNDIGLKPDAIDNLYNVLNIILLLLITSDLHYDFNAKILFSGCVIQVSKEGISKLIEEAVRWLRAADLSAFAFLK